MVWDYYDIKKEERYIRRNTGSDSELDYSEYMKHLKEMQKQLMQLSPPKTSSELAKRKELFNKFLEEARKVE